MGTSDLSSLVLRAWKEDGALRVRVIHANGPPDEARIVCSSIAEVQAEVARWLQSL